MRRMVAMAEAVTAGALAWSRIRERGPGVPRPVKGISRNGMAYARWGSGPEGLLVIPGGPENTPPSGMMLSRYLRIVRPLVEEGWTIWVVARKQRLPPGCSIADMAVSDERFRRDVFEFVQGKQGGRPATGQRRGPVGPGWDTPGPADI
jgi:hypothetical protein